MKYFFEKIKKNRHLEHVLASWTLLHTIAAFFGVLFLVINVKLFMYTVLEGKYYKQLADAQQIGEITVPVNRGMIYSSVDRGEYGLQQSGAFATSINLYNISIDPTIEGNKQKLTKYLVDLLYTEICTREEYCEDKLLRFLRLSTLEDYVYSESYIKGILEKNIFKKVAQEKLTSVLIDKELTKEQLNLIERREYAGVYPSGNYIYVNPEEIQQKDIENIAKAIHMNLERFKHLVRKRPLRYVPVINKLSIAGSEKLKEYIQDEKDAIRRGLVEKKDSISGFFILEPEATRYYPEGSIGAQIIGFVDNAGVGHYGLEGYFNDVLKGSSGMAFSTKDVHGRVIDPVTFEEENGSQKGLEIITTIDRNIQKKVEEIIKKGVINFRAVKGTIVVTEPKTGKIIAMANYPSYNINMYGSVYEMEKINNEDFKNPKVDLLGYPIFVEDKEEGKPILFDGKELFLREATYDELGDEALVKYKYKNGFGAGVYQNDAVSSIYEPGSIMKSITFAIAVDAGEIKPTDMYNDVNELVISGFPISNVAKKQCGGYHTFQNALNFSCNIGMVRIIQKVGRALAHRYFEDFGFSHKTGIELEGEVSGILAPWEKISRSNSLTRSYGLGVSVTPLQMAAAYNVLANGGVYMKPQIIEKIIYPDGREIAFKPEIKRRVLKESTSKIMSKVLYDSIENGLADKGKVEGYSLGGKTGTAQIFERGKYQSGPGGTNASYAGYGPVEDPKFTIIVKLSRPKANVYGGQTSARLFHDVAEYLFTYYNIPKKNTTGTIQKTDV